MILMPIPDFDFDPTETSVPWKILTDNNVDVAFATPSGKPGKADPRMLTGKDLGIWKNILMARDDALHYYSLMTKDGRFRNPIRYGDIRPSDYSGIILPGGHAPGTKPYLESRILQNVIVKFFESMKPVGAICHGVLLVARSIDPKTGESIIYDYKTTALLKSQELSGYYLTRLWLGRYYRTYPITVEDEVKSKLRGESSFIRGNAGLIRDSIDNTRPGFALRDRNYLSARWPGDAFRFSFEFLNLINRAVSGANERSGVSRRASGESASRRRIAHA